MARKKERIMAFDTLQPDTLHRHTERVCRNFVCFEKNIRDCLDSQCRKDDWKHSNTSESEIKTLLGYQTELRDGLGNLGIDMVSLVPITLEKSVKTTTPYIYRTMDYSLSKPAIVFGTKKDALQTIQKKIKTKNVVMYYDGKMERCEFNIDYIDQILGTLEEDTIDFSIEPIGRNGMEGDTVMVSIYKNCMNS